MLRITDKNTKKTCIARDTELYGPQLQYFKPWSKLPSLETFLYEKEFFYPKD